MIRFYLRKRLFSTFSSTPQIIPTPWLLLCRAISNPPPRLFSAPYLFGTREYGEGQSKKLSGNPKILLQLHRNPKISAHNIKYPETMQIEVRIASSKHRNISSTILDVKTYNELNFNFILTQKYHFYEAVKYPKIPKNITKLFFFADSKPKISDLPPRMCICWVPPLGSNNKNKDKDEYISNHRVLPGSHVSRGFRCLFGQKTVYNLLFEKYSRFHISNIIWDIIRHLDTFVWKAPSSYL